MRKKSKKTDLVSCVCIVCRLVISNQLKEIFEKFGGLSFQYLPIKIVALDVEYPYWLANPIKYEMTYINYKLSDIWLTGGGGVKQADLAFSDYNEFIDFKKTIQPPIATYINKLVLNNSLHKDLFVLENVPDGFGFYVSENCKTEIENTKCTGLSFEQIHVE